MFARKVYSEERLQEALRSVGLTGTAEGFEQATRRIQAMRWHLKFRTGFDPSRVAIPKRFKEVVTARGPIDEGYLNELGSLYGKAVADLASQGEAAFRDEK
jgi:aldehyde:ferredoxin oxidoreductase